MFLFAVVSKLPPTDWYFKEYYPESLHKLETNLNATSEQKGNLENQVALKRVELAMQKNPVEEKQRKYIDLKSKAADPYYSKLDSRILENSKTAESMYKVEKQKLDQLKSELSALESQLKDLAKKEKDERKALNRAKNN